MLASLTNNPDIQFALAVVALILAGVVVAQSRLTSILGWAVVAASLALCLAWWPS